MIEQFIIRNLGKKRIVYLEKQADILAGVIGIGSETICYATSMLRFNLLELKIGIITFLLRKIGHE